MGDVKPERVQAPEEKIQALMTLARSGAI